MFTIQSNDANRITLLCNLTIALHFMANFLISNASFEQNCAYEWDFYAKYLSATLCQCVRICVNDNVLFSVEIQAKPKDEHT